MSTWTHEMLLLAQAAGVEIGPEKFGLPSDTQIGNVPGGLPPCLVCGFIWSCHSNWECPTRDLAQHRDHTAHHLKLRQRWQEHEREASGR